MNKGVGRLGEAELYYLYEYGLGVETAAIGSHAATAADILTLSVLHCFLGLKSFDAWTDRRISSAMAWDAQARSY